jgi:hypothetical protein
MRMEAEESVYDSDFRTHGVLWREDIYKARDD